jgi:hypothetical protein
MAEIKKISTELQLLDKFLDTSGDAGTSGQVLTSTGTGINWVSGGSLPGGPYLPLSAGSSYPLTNSLYLENTSGSAGASPSLYFKNGSGNFWRYLHESGGDFSIKEGTATRLTFKAGGNVGIGTTSPSNTLDVNGGAEINGETYIRSTSNVGLRIQTTDQGTGGNDGLRVGLNGTHAFVWQYENKPLSFATNGGQRMTISAGGNVGIGTTSPSYGLDVNHNAARIGSSSQTTTSLYLTATNTAGAPAVATEIIMQGYEGRAKGTFYTDSGVDGEWFNGVPYNGNHNYWQVGFNETGGQAEYQANSILTVRDNGNVGIGTTSPGQKLEVAGRVRISTDPTVELYNTSTNRGGVQWVNGSLMTKMFSGGSAGAGAGIIFETNTSEKVRITSGGNVGIGTTNPNKRLSVETNDTATYSASVNASEISIARKNSSNTAGQVAAISLNATGWSGSTTGVVVLNAIARQGNFSNADFAIQNRVGGNFVETFRITTYGNVGIGTDTPDDNVNTGNYFKPDSGGRFLTAKDSSGSFIMLESSTTTDNDQIGGIYFNNTGGQTDAHVHVAGIDAILHKHGTNDALSGGDLRFFTKPSGSGVNGPRMVILENGNIGIGTTAPAQKLHVSGGHILLDNNKEIRQKDSGGTERTVFELDSSNDLNIGGSYAGALKFIGGGSYAEVMRIHDDGNVGIGDSGPKVKLQVSTSSPTNKVAVSIGDGWVGNDLYHKEGGLLLISGTSQDSTHTGAGLAFQTRNTQNTNYWKSSIIMDRDGAMRFTLGGAGTSQGSEDLTILSSGNVGIGTTSPADKLTVNGNLSVFTNKIYNGSASNSAGLDFVGAKANIHGYHGITFNSSNAGIGSQTERMRITSTGNVGIGTTAPTSKLQVSTATNVITPLLTLHNSTSTNGSTAGASIDFVASSNVAATGARIISTRVADGAHMDLRFHTQRDQFAMIIDTSGNVGIGVTTPTHKLHVNGNMRLTGALRDSNNAPGSAGQVLSSTGSATDWIPLPATPTIYTPKVYNLNNSTNINSQGQKLVPDFGTLEIEGNTTIQQVSGSDTDFQVTGENTGIYEVTYAVFYKNTGNQRTPLGTYLTLNGTAVNGSLMVNYVRSNVAGGGNFSSCTNTFYVNVTDASHPIALCVRRADSSTAPSGISMVEPAGMAVKSTISFRRIS